VPEGVSAHLTLVDTSAYFALLDRTDRHHRDAIQFLKMNDTPLVTTDLIVVETLNLVRVRLGHRQAIQLGIASSIPP
jgi:predicted nucleic acid-binding protein